MLKICKIVQLTKPCTSVRKKEIAEIKTRTATRGEPHGDGEIYAAENAIDRDLLTQAVTKTDGEAAWLKFEFDKTYFINKVVIYYKFYKNNWYGPNFSCAQSEAHFKGCVESDNNVDVSVYKGDVKVKSCGILQLTYGLEQSDQIYTLLCNTEGDTVKLSKISKTIAVNEVAITNTGKYWLCKIKNQDGRHIIFQPESNFFFLIW